MSIEKITVGQITYDLSKKDKVKGIYNGTIKNQFEIKVRLVKSESTSEVESLLKLNSHPNVQSILDYCLENSTHYFGLQHYDITLKEFITNAENKKIDRIQIIRDITEGLKFLHDNHMIHGNLSFNNIGICNKTKSALLCNSGLDDLQEQIFQAPEQFSCESSSFKADIFSLGIIIYYILSCGSHPFGLFEHENDMKKNIRLCKFKNGFGDLKSLLQNEKSLPKSNDLNCTGECALSLIRKILTINAECRPNCEEILLEPMFWKTFEVYNFFKKIGLLWKKLTADDITMINRKGKKYFSLLSWGDKLQRIIKNENFSPEEKKDFICLVKFVSSKAKHFEEDFYSNFEDEHILFYLNEFPFLLKFVYNMNNRINILEDENQNEASIYEVGSEPSTSGRTNENKKLYEICVKYGLPTSSNILICKSDVQCLKKIKKSENKAKAKIFNGKYKNEDVAIKKVSKNEKQENIENEIRSFAKMENLKSKCISCGEKVCENVIRFKGCYEEQDYFCFVLEKAEMDFADLLTELKEQNLKNESMKAVNDVRINRILFHTIKGLECLHANSVYHLDMKPQNILIVKRNGDEIGCLTDFGSSKYGPSVRLFTKLFDVTEIYVAPELKRYLNRARKANPQKIDYKKCDIFSYGMIFKKDVLGYMLDTDDDLTTVDIEKFYDAETLSLASVEFAIVTSNVDHKKRPYAEAVRKNPYFYDNETKLKFFRDIHYFVFCRHETDEAQIKNIEKQALWVFNPKNVKLSDERYSWLGFLKAKENEIFCEIKAFIKKRDEEENSKSKMKQKTRTKKSNLTENEMKQNQDDEVTKEESIFFLLKVIITIYDQTESDEFKETRKILKISNIDEYLNFWLKKFELVVFLHNKMQNLMEPFYEAYYSIQSTKRNLGNRRFLSRSIDLPDYKRSISKVSNNTESNQNQNKRSRN